MSNYPTDAQLKLLEIIVAAVKKNDNKPIHQNDAARLLRRKSEELGIKTRERKRKEYVSHADLITSHVMNKGENFEKALKELLEVPTGELGKTKTHHLDIEVMIKNILKTLPKVLEKMRYLA